MKVKDSFIDFFHLEKRDSLMEARSVFLLIELFNLLDIHHRQALNDIQFCTFLSHVTDLSTDRIYKVFDMLDIDGSGDIEFDEFYFMMCILTAIHDKQEKQFIYRHSRNVFDLLDEDGSNTVSAYEFEHFGFLFNFEGAAVKKIFQEFDISGDEELDYKEFRMFAMACIDAQNEMEAKQKKEFLLQRSRKLEKRKLVVMCCPHMQPEEEETNNAESSTPSNDATMSGFAQVFEKRKPRHSLASIRETITSTFKK